MIEVLGLMVVAYGTSICAFSRILTGEYSHTGIICIVIGIAHTILPMNALSELVFPEKEVMLTSTPYKDAKQCR